MSLVFAFGAEGRPPRGAISTLVTCSESVVNAIVGKNDKMIDCDKYNIPP